MYSTKFTIPTPPFVSPTSLPVSLCWEAERRSCKPRILLLPASYCSWLEALAWDPGWEQSQGCLVGWTGLDPQLMAKQSLIRQPLPRATPAGLGTTPTLPSTLCTVKAPIFDWPQNMSVSVFSFPKSCQHICKHSCLVNIPWIPHLSMPRVSHQNPDLCSS